MPRQILLIEDDHNAADVLAAFLGEAYDVMRARTGAEALTLLRGHPVDLVVLDHRLPDGTGLDFLAEIRAIRPRLPVIMTTGYGSEWLCASAFKLGASDYLPKPMSEFDLLSSVGRVLSTAEDARDRGGRVPVAPAARQEHPQIQKAIRLIQQRYWDRLSLAELASQIGMSKYHFSRRFKAVTGMGFREYLLSVRLSRAKQLLSSGRPGVTEVALMAGFGDLPRLDKMFKRSTGLTPSKYRDQERTSGAA
jgi:two-component system, response regulator YesN